MVGTVEDAGAGVPGVLAEEEREEGEEEAGDFEPEGGADMFEGPRRPGRSGECLLRHGARARRDFFAGLEAVAAWPGAGRWLWGGWRGVVAAGCGCGLGGALFAIREATRTPMPSLRPKRFGSMGEV